MSQTALPSGMLFVEFMGTCAGPRATPLEPDRPRRHHAILTGDALKFGGVIAKSEPHGYQIVFSGPAQAINCALAFLFRFAEYNKACDDPAQRVSLRQAVHQGAFQLQNDGVPREVAEILAQMLKVTPPGRIFSTRAAYAPSLGKTPCEFIPLGCEYFQGLRTPVDIFEVIPAPGGRKELSA